MTAGKDIFLPAEPGEGAGRTRENALISRHLLQNEADNKEQRNEEIG